MKKTKSEAIKLDLIVNMTVTEVANKPVRVIWTTLSDAETGKVKFSAYTKNIDTMETYCTVTSFDKAEVADAYIEMQLHYNNYMSTDMMKAN